MKQSGILLPSLWAVFLLGCVVASSESDEEDGYIFTCPRSLKTGATNEIQLHRYGSLVAGQLTLKVLYQDSYSSNESVAIEKTYDIEEGVRDSYLELHLEPFDTYVYNGKVVISGSFGDYKIEGTDKVYFSSVRDSVVFIQTDKPLYKEGQTVKFRILRVDKDLKPSTDAEADIYVEDPKGTRLFQWNDVDLSQGMKQFEFPLADEPVQGDWKISVSFDGDITTTTIEVKEYVLPKFEVTIEPPSYVLANSEEIPIKICAKYTYGKSVKGDLRMNISLETFTWSTEKIPVLEYSGLIDGCFDYTINVSLIESDDYYRYRRVQITCSVEEFGTGVQRNETQFIQRVFSPLNLNFNQDQRQFYKPGLPYNGKLSVKNPDDTPSVDEGVQICYTVSRERVLSNWWATKKIKFCKNYTSDEEGIIEYIIPPQSTDSVGITIEAFSLKYAKKTEGTKRENSLSQPQTSMSLTPWYSPSGSFIQLQPVQETLFCGSKKSFKLLFTSKESADFRFYYQVLSQGNVVYSGFIEKSFSTDDDVSNEFEDENKLVNDKEVQLVPPIDSSKAPAPEEECPSAREARYVPPVGEVTIELEIDSSWSPSFHLLMYYIRDDRETVADSQKFKVEKCFKNQVKLQFKDSVKQPATKTSIRVSSSPNSLCGIKIVDKSVSLLNPNDQLTKEKIFNILESFDTGMYYGVNHCNEDVPQPGLYRSSSSTILPPRPPKPWSSSPYEDSLAAFENTGFLVISDLVLLTRPCKNRGGGNGNIVYESDSAGFGGGGYGGAARVKVPLRRKSYNRKMVAMASTARRPRPPAAAAMPVAQNKVGVEATKSVVEVRNYFPETWLFSMEMTGEDGEYVTKKKLPHTITEWVGSAVCINAEDGLGISNKTSIQGFQAFFLSFTLPYSVIRGEQFWITISIFSYVEDALPIKISLDELEGFKIVSESIEGEICLQPESSTNLKLKLEPIALGQQNITVRAETAQGSDVCEGSTVSDAIAKDAVENYIIVEPEGFPVEDVESVLLCPKDEEDGVFKKTFSIGVPEDIVPDSERGYLDVTGNVLGKSLDSLENLVSIPTGCGEQNMVKFVPNVVAMNLLQKTDQLTEKMESRIIKNLITGAQRQMKYAHPDGSFSAFGPRDKEGSMFLTAFVLRYFTEATKYITIDNSTLVKMQNWIISKQQEDGCFPDVGKIIDRGLQGAIEKGKSQGLITAYVTASLWISGCQNQTVLDSAMSCIKDSEDKSFYSKFLFSYTEALSDNVDSAKERISSAKEKAITKGGVEYYHDLNATKSQDLETAAYAVLAILRSGGSAKDALRIVQYLMQNMNPRGGFFSTQDTCVGLEALGEFAMRTNTDPVAITMKTSGGLVKDIEITEDDKLIVKRYKIQNVPSDVNVEAEGSGCAVIQNIVRYNTKTPPEKRSFNIDVASECSDDKCSKGSISITVSYIPEGKKTGMALVEVKMISGISPDKDSLEELLADTQLQLMRYEVENNIVVLYFNEITNTKKRIPFRVTKVVPVDNAQPGVVAVYDYYNRDISSKTSYSLGSCDESSCSKEQ